MNLKLTSDASVPVSALNAFDTIAILLLVPLFDQYVYPKCKEKGYPLTMLGKIGIGFGIATIAMVVAALIEVWRLKLAPPAGNYYDVSARDHISGCQGTAAGCTSRRKDATWNRHCAHCCRPLVVSQCCK